MNPDTALSRLVPSSLFLPLSLSLLLLAGCDSGGGGSAPPPPLNDPDVQTIGCTDSEGMDLFAAESNAALGLSWNNHANFNAAAGYQIRYGTATGNYASGTVPVAGCTALDCEATLSGLNNDETYYVVVDALSAPSTISGTSCELAARPHLLSFSDDIPVKTSSNAQTTPVIASSFDGTPLFMGWIENSKFVLSRSDDYGITWSTPVTVLAAGSQSNPNLTFRRRVSETDANGNLVITVNPALFVTLVVDGTVKIFRGDFPVDTTDQSVYPLGAVTFSAAFDVDAGDFPTTASYADHIEVAYENSGIWVRSSANGGDSYSTEKRIDNASGGQTSTKPDVAIDAETGDVFIAYQGKRDEGNDDIYLNYSKDKGANYQPAETRIDDDIGSTQSNVSISTDPRTNHVMATWEDARNGKDVYFTRSLDGGVTWDQENLDSGNGLQGDQSQPVAEVDPGRNVFVLFIDTNNGARPFFNRFNALGVFEIPKEVSSAAGSSGTEAKDPALTIDKFGRVYVAWSENRDGPVDNIFFARGQ